jgi:hypothetical protein
VDAHPAVLPTSLATDAARDPSASNVEFVGLVVIVAVIANVVALSLSVVANVNGTSTTTPVVGEVVAEADQRNVPVANTSAFDGTTDRSPNPNEATATSATRLKVVFVDIFFLSISRDRESPALGFG